MSFVLLGILNSQAAGGAGAISYFLGLLGGAGDEQLEDIAIDSTGKLITNGRMSSTGTNGSSDYYITSINLDGTPNFERAFGGGGAEYGYRVGVDSSDNIYAAGRDVNNFVIAKYDSSGTLQGQFNIDQGAYDQASGGIKTDSSGNIYVCGLSNALGANNNLLVALNSSFVIQWQKILAPTSGASTYNTIHVDSSANVYVIGHTQGTTAGLYDALLAKYDSSGTLQWQKVIGGSGNDYGYGVATDSSGNLYCAVQWLDTTTKLVLLKFNSSGTLQWQRYLSGGTGATFPRRVSVDSSDNIYVAGMTDEDGEGGYDWLIAKYDTSGTIQWQRTIGSTGSDSLGGMEVDADGNIYLGGWTSAAGAGSNDNFYGVIPSDGSLTGTVSLDSVNFVYQASTLTEGSATATVNSGSNTDTTATASVGTPTFTSASVTLTNYLATL